MLLLLVRNKLLWLNILFKLKLINLTFPLTIGHVKEMHNKTEDCLLSFMESEGINYYLLLLIHFLCKFVKCIIPHYRLFKCRSLSHYIIPV